MQNCTRPNRPDLDATKVPNELDIAWAAGIYEGEGHCRLCGRTKRGLSVTVVQKDPEILYRLREWFGGRVTDNCTGSGAHVWECNGDRARIFLGLVYGFMSARRKMQIDATNALEYLVSRSPERLTKTELENELLAFYEAHRSAVKERVRKAKREQYLRYRAQPGWRDEDLAKKAEMRKKLTPEQKEKMSEYQQQRYLRQKQERETALIQ